MLRTFDKDEKGFSLVELLIVMGISSILLIAVYETFISERRAITAQELITEMHQNVRAALDMMVREIRMAGYDPTGAGFTGIVNPTSSQIGILLDQNSNGDHYDSNEDITYSYDSANLRIRRKTGISGTNQPFAENITLFHLDYFDPNGAQLSSSPADPSVIRQIKITITGRTDRADPDYPRNNGYRIYTVTSLVTPKNLDL
ncbi:prepilin-type N-terminal cleavage/methylation domain-containing protein [bacterium]|nr:prepilin-type N-terminal cleavage/methylation domain-containing protein [bacterium]